MNGVPPTAAPLPRRDVDLTISIVTFNSSAEIGPCLAALPAAIGDLTYQVVVVDSASTDQTVELVERSFRQVELIRSPRNLGFGAGQNVAMRRGIGRFHLALNPDTLPAPGSLLRLVRYLQTHPRVALVGPAILEADASLYPSCRSFPTPGALLFRNRILSRLFPRNPYTRSYLLAEADHSRPLSVDWLSGSVILASRDAIDRVGIFDERFFMYCEDMDWCKRACLTGQEVHYNPEAVVTHFRARSTDQRIPAMIIEHHRSMWKYYLKYDRTSHGRIFSAGVGVAIALRALIILGTHYFRRLTGRTPDRKRMS